MTSSRDGGATWTPNVRVNDVPIDRTIGSWINNIDVMAPVAVASLKDGAVVAWSDTRNGNAISNTQDIFTGTVTFGESRDQPRRPASRPASWAHCSGWAWRCALPSTSSAGTTRRRRRRPGGWPRSQSRSRSCRREGGARPAARRPKSAGFSSPGLQNPAHFRGRHTFRQIVHKSVPTSRRRRYRPMTACICSTGKLSMRPVVCRVRSTPLSPSSDHVAVHFSVTTTL